MRADEPMGIHERNKLSIRQDVDYINQLRYERLMAKARRYYSESNSKICLRFYFEITKNKTKNEIIKQLNRIAEALEARARRIKERM